MIERRTSEPWAPPTPAGGRIPRTPVLCDAVSARSAETASPEKGPGTTVPWRGVGRSPTILFVSLLALLLFTGNAFAVQNFNIKIGVAENMSSGKLLGSGLALRDARGAKLSVGNGATVTAAGNAVKVGKKTLALPVRITAKSGLGWDKTKYRGSFLLVKAGSKFTVVNEVDLENYLRGILKIEMNPEWHFEALKAQAILARTYAVKNRGRFASKGYDLCATANSQVYRGINAEDARTDRAVAATRGQILTWNGAPADIYYHSDSGGSTADVSHVWGGSRPYLQAKPERVAYTSPHSTWQVNMTPAQVAGVLGKMGKNVGNVTAIEVSQKDGAGRAVQLRIRGDRGMAEVKAHAFRMAAGSSVIRSTNFIVSSGGARAAASTPVPVNPPVASSQAADVTIAGLADFPPNADPLIEMAKMDVFTKDEVYDMLFNPGKRDEYLRIGLERLSGKTVKMPQQNRKPNPAPVPASKPATAVSGAFHFQGKGWGHGVGLSQWGAKAMADQGMKCEAILAHYFPGTKIAK